MLCRYSGGSLNLKSSAKCPAGSEFKIMQNRMVHNGVTEGPRLIVRQTKHAEKMGRGNTMAVKAASETAHRWLTKAVS